MEKINAHIANQIEYETTHIDAGRNYLHMVAESWCSEQQKRFVEVCDENGIDFRGVDPERVSELAIEWCDATSGNMFGCSVDGLIELDSWAIQELEIWLPDELRETEIDETEIDGTLSANGENVYVTTDAFWFATIKPDTLQDLINSELEG